MILLSTVLGYGQVRLEPVCANTTETYGVSGLPGSIFKWEIEGGQIISDDDLNDTVLIKWDYSTGTRTISVTEMTSSGCWDITEATLVVRAPFVELGYNLPEICQGDSLILNVGNQFQEPYEILWNSGSSAQEYTSKSTELIWVRVIDGFGCMRYDTVNLTVNQLPVVNLGKDTVLCDVENPLTIYYDQIMVNADKEFGGVTWKLGNVETNDNFVIINPLEEYVDTLIATITNRNGCVSTDTLMIYPCDVSKLFLKMPNTITPNGSVNKVWNIPYMDIFTEAELEIFDRWGRLVYRTENVYEQPWDGKSNGKMLPMDSYYYVLKLNFKNAKPLVGTVNLIK
jgi:gliding motility-associated-like protein